MPDSVTTWRLSSKAVSSYDATGETLVGQSSSDVVATLPLLIRPVTPRFFVVGDTLPSFGIDGFGPLRLYAWDGGAWVGRDLLEFALTLLWEHNQSGWLTHQNIP